MTAVAVVRRERPPCAQRSVPGATLPPSNTATDGAAIAPRSARGWVARADLAVTTAAPRHDPADSSHLTRPDATTMRAQETRASASRAAAAEQTAHTSRADPAL